MISIATITTEGLLEQSLAMCNISTVSINQAPPITTHFWEREWSSQVKPIARYAPHLDLVFAAQQDAIIIYVQGQQDFWFTRAGLPITGVINAEILASRIEAIQLGGKHSGGYTSTGTD